MLATNIYSGLITLAVYCLSFCCPAPVSLPAEWSFPTDWRSRITDEAYNYSLSKAATLTKETMYEGDIKGIDTGGDVNHQGFYVSRNAIVDKSMRWQQGVVPYEISDSFDAEQKRLIEEALRDIMAKTCVRFTLHRDEKDYISFVNRGFGAVISNVNLTFLRNFHSCSSYVARTGGKQTVDLMPGCLTYIGEPQHEVMHALGFFHEQSRTDRDQYVTIVWNNLIPGTDEQFRTYRTDNLDMPYDYGSIMHYGWNYFAKESTLPTIIPKTTSKVALGTRKIISASDVEKINRLYECPGHSRAETARPTPATRATTVSTARTTTVGRRLPGTAPSWNVRPPGTPPSWNAG